MPRRDLVPNHLVDSPEAHGAGVCNISEASKILVPPCGPPLDFHDLDTAMRDKNVIRVAIKSFL